MRRRDFLPALAAPLAMAQAQTPQPVKLKGKFKQGVCGGVFARGMSMADPQEVRHHADDVSRRTGREPSRLAGER
jgi:hypothetical protein